MFILWLGNRTRIVTIMNMSKLTKKKKKKKKT